MTTPDADAIERRRRVAAAGHTGRLDQAMAGLDDPVGEVRATALGALDRLGALTDATLASHTADPAPVVRRRVAELGARHHRVPLEVLLRDEDPLVVDAAAFAAGERPDPDPSLVEILSTVATGHHDARVRESAVAALGAIGHAEGRAAVLSACQDKPAVRRRAVQALAAFEGPEVEAALDRALEDRDWQVRQAAEDLTGDHERRPHRNGRGDRS